MDRQAVGIGRQREALEVDVDPGRAVATRRQPVRPWSKQRKPGGATGAQSVDTAREGEELTTTVAQRHTGHADRRQERGRELPGLQVIAASPRNRLSRARTTMGGDTTQPRTVGRVSIELTWRGPFENGEVNALHSAAFATRVYSDEEWNWRELVDRHSLGWVVARDDVGLAGFANVVWDGFVHASIQDVMVDDRVGRQGVGTAIVAACADGVERLAARSCTSTSTTISPPSTSTPAVSHRRERACCTSAVPSRLQAGLSCPDDLARPPHAARGVGAADVGALVGGLRLSVDCTLERGGKLRVDPAEQVDRRQMALVARALPERVAGDRVAGCDRRVDHVGGNHIGCVEQLRCLEELAGVDEALTCLRDIARLRAPFVRLIGDGPAARWCRP